MNIGESRTDLVKARRRWNNTGIKLSAGERYAIASEGKWVDWFIPHGPEGDPSDRFYMRAFESLRRMPRENWFTLIGCLNSDITTAFRIGASCTYFAIAPGDLTCFANDVEYFYWNNWGEVTITVTREA